MKVALVPIGNSRGVRLPKPVIEQCGFGPIVELQIVDNRVVIAPDRSCRHGWADAFQEMARRGDDTPIFEDAAPTEFDSSEWTW